MNGGRIYLPKSEDFLSYSYKKKTHSYINDIKLW
jgi:hypothetical protein